MPSVNAPSPPYDAVLLEPHDVGSQTPVSLLEWRGRRGRRLLSGVGRPDPDALRALDEEYGGTVFGFLVATLRDRAAAEDVHQEVFLEVWRRSAGFDPSRGSVLSWIMTIARSRAIDHLRKRVPEPHDPAGVAALADTEDAEGSTDALLEQWRLAHLLRRLPKEEALLLRMRFRDGLSQSEIAERSGIPLGTVKMRMVQGLARLRDMIETEERTP
jgi:RNA polymerase sigma-70 factor (ECF subfamily)